MGKVLTTKRDLQSPRHLPYAIRFLHLLNTSVTIVSPSTTLNVAWEKVLLTCQ